MFFMTCKTEEKKLIINDLLDREDLEPNQKVRLLCLLLLV